MNTKNLFLGGVFVLLGVLFLGRNFGWFDFEWGQLVRFWPVLIILLGINVIWGKASPAATVVLVILLCLAIPAAIVRNVRDDWKDNHRFEWSERDWDDDTDNDSESRSSRRSSSQRLVEPYADSLSAATFRLTGGAAEFDIEETTSQLVEADARLSFGKASLQKRASDGKTELTLSLNGKGSGREVWNNDGFSNHLAVRLNTAPLWDLYFEFGAGEADFDLSPYRVRSLNLQTGVASAQIRLGNRAPETTVNVESGVAEVEFEVPRGVGCRIETDGALNVKEFDEDDFVRVGNAYETPGYAQATQKINIRFDGGLGKWKVSRY
jgi:hypothetical protein